MGCIWFQFFLSNILNLIESQCSHPSHQMLMIHAFPRGVGYCGDQISMCAKVLVNSTFIMCFYYCFIIMVIFIESCFKIKFSKNMH